MSAPTLTLLVPGLTASPAGPALTRLFRFADRNELPVSGTIPTLAWLAGIDGELPAGAFTALAGGAAVPDGGVMRLDPVHLAADADGLRLLPAAALDLHDDESAALAAFLEVQHGLPVTRAGSRFWTTTHALEGAALTPVYEVAGKHIGPFLPDGRARMELRRWLNEAQMVLHDCPVNRRRLDAGALTVNSVWPWGGGVLPERVDWRHDHAYADDPVVTGLAVAAGAAGGPLPGDFDGLPPDGNRFAWIEDPTRLEEDWVGPAWRALREGALAELRLFDGAGHAWTMRPRMRWRFWRMLD